jgi:hypothetical protein
MRNLGFGAGWRPATGNHALKASSEDFGIFGCGGGAGGSDDGAGGGGVGVATGSVVPPDSKYAIASSLDHIVILSNTMSMSSAIALAWTCERKNASDGGWKDGAEAGSQRTSFSSSSVSGIRSRIGQVSEDRVKTRNATFQTRRFHVCGFRHIRQRFTNRLIYFRTKLSAPFCSYSLSSNHCTMVMHWLVSIGTGPRLTRTAPRSSRISSSASVKPR